jgi:glycosyltransferase involved in cell wall biosynthesis
LHISIVIVTANRADELGRTLASLARVRPVGECELLVVDNNSKDPTQKVVDDMRSAFPYDVRYIFVPTPGKYGALNTAIQISQADLVVATDDDARFEDDWLEQAVRGIERYDCDFVGGPVRPLWGARPPDWLPKGNGLHDKVIAVLDHGQNPRPFGKSISWPLGVNVVYRRSAFARAGLFDASLGRTAGTLRNQAQREWHLRAASAGLQGMYLPEMVVHHVVPPERLTKQYFRRWLYWHGISRAILFRQRGLDMENPDDPTPVAGRRQLVGVPSHLIIKAIRSLRSLIWRTLTGDSIDAFERELWLCFFAGVVRQRWTDRHVKPPAVRRAH